MEINKLNIKQIVSIRSFEKSDYFFLTYKEARGYWFWKTEAGFYDSLFPKSAKTKEQVEKDGTLIVEGKRVYYRPHVEIKTSDGRKHTKFFKTVDGMKKFLNLPELKYLTFIDK